MKWTRLECCALWLIAFAIVVGNVLVLLPPSWTFRHFMPAFVVPNVEIALEPSEPWSLTVFDRTRAVQDMPLAQRRSIEVAEQWLEDRHIEHLVNVSKIDLRIHSLRSPAEENHLWRTWDARDIWWPDEVRPVRFILAQVLSTLPPGRYEMRATLYAEPRWAAGRIPGGQIDGQDERLRQAVLPGRFFLQAVSTEPLVVDVTDAFAEVLDAAKQQSPESN